MKFIDNQQQNRIFLKKILHTTNTVCNHMVILLANKPIKKKEFCIQWKKD